MKNSSWEVIVCIALAICFFIAGCRAGTESGYNDGFREGVQIAEEHAQECVFELSHTVKDKFDNYSSTFFELVTTALFLIILVGIVTSIVFSSIISKPLLDVSDAAKKITDGDFGIKIQNSNFSEINELIYSYNEMAFQLNELYSSLELKVQERTLALETANHKLQETQAMMVHSEKMRSLGELVAGIAHEINNPINFIHGNIMILQNYVADLLSLIDLYEANNVTIPEKIKEEQQNIESAVKKQLPTNKEEFKEQLKDNLKTGLQNQLEKNEKVQEIKQNKAVKNLTDIYKFYKQSSSETTAPVEKQ